MNIEVQCCGVVILMLIWCFSLRQRPLGLESKKLFLLTMGVTSFCLVLDIVSVVAICYRELIPVFLLEMICKTYIVSLVWVGYCGLIYSSNDFVTAKEDFRKRNRIYTVMVLTGTVLIYVLPIYYYHEGMVVYTYGPSCITTYIFALLFVVATLYKVGVKGKDMNPKRRRAILMWMFIWIVAAVTQFFNASLLLVGFTSVIGVVILFFELENPEASIDKETGAYNAHALGEYAKQLYMRQKPFSVLMLAINDAVVASEEDNSSQVSALLCNMVRYAEKLKGVKVFKTLERELILMTADGERMQEVFQDVKRYMENIWGENREEALARVSPSYVLLPDSSMLRNVEEVFQLLHHSRVEVRKALEGNGIILDEERIAHFKEQETIEAMIKAALAEDRIEVFYQPIYSIKEHKFVSAEALARIRDKDGNIVPPGKFIPIAEKNGLISRIGERVFEKTCIFIKENQLRERYGIEYVEVNLSVKQCEDTSLADTYILIMEKHKMDPSCVNLEITESASIRRRNNLLKNMEVLIDYGVKFSLDDFGNGESNLNYIVDMPVSIVKFDRDMSQAYFANQKAKFVMEASMHMIHDMGLEIVSEGVETKEQMEAVAALGIEYIQGYYFSKPLPADEFLRFVAEADF